MANQIPPKAWHMTYPLRIPFSIFIYFWMALTSALEGHKANAMRKSTPLPLSPSRTRSLLTHAVDISEDGTWWCTWRQSLRELEPRGEGALKGRDRTCNLGVYIVEWFKILLVSIFWTFLAREYRCYFGYFLFFL